MRYDELAHYGVRGMRWRFKKGSIIDPKNKNARVKKPDSSVRVEGQKNLALSGTSNKRFSSSEKVTENTKAQSELAKKAEEAAKEHAEDLQKRQESADKAFERSLSQAKERAAANAGRGTKSSSGNGGNQNASKDDSKGPSIKRNSTNNDKFKEINRRDREYTYQQNAINKSQGIDRVNVMNDKTKTDEQFKKKKK